MTLALQTAQTEPMPTEDTSAATLLSPQERPCTSLTSFSEAEAVRSRPAPPAVYCTRDPIPAPCPRQVAFQLRPDAPAFVPSQPSAIRSAPAAEPNESDLLPALDFGREKLLSSTESEDALKVCTWLARTLAIVLYLRPSSCRCSSRCYHQ